MPSNEAKNKTLAFIIDWQKRSAKQQRIFVIVLLASLVLAILISLSGFVWYQNNNYERTIEHNMNYLLDNALQEVTDVEQRMDENLSLIQKYAKQYDYLETSYPDGTVQERIRILWDSTIFDRVSYISPDGALVSTEGTAEVGDRAYFQDALRGNAGYLLLSESRVTKQPVLAFYTPIYHDGKITGVLLGLHERERIDHQLTYTFLNYEPKTYLLQGDGIVIGSSNDKYLTENMFDVLASREFRGDVDYDEVMNVIRDDRRKTVSFTFIDEGSSSIGVVAQFKKGDMMLLTVLPSAITDSMISEANSAGWRLVISVFVAFIALLTVFTVFLFRQRSRTTSEMTLATESLISTTEHDQKQSFIVESLSNTFTSVYYAEIENQQYERLAEQNAGVVRTVTDTGHWPDEYTLYINEFVLEAYRERMRVFLDLPGCAKQLENGETLSVEYQRPDKDWRRAVMIPAETDSDGHIKSIIFAVQKIDAEKRRELDTKKALEEAYEAAKMASGAKTTFLSNMSHDIRTPMNAIVGMTAIAAANIDNKDKVTDCLHKITASSRHLLGLINEVLDMSKIESGKVDLNEEDFSLSDVLDELIFMNQPVIRNKNHSLIVKVHNLTHEKVVGDRVRLQQVFTNLLTNAIKYTPAGGKISIDVSEKQTNKSSIGWYEVVFRDTGIGMTEEFRKRIFEPFSRADDERITAIQGTGLGMPIARNIIRMMNGDITVESELNCGSAFTVSFSLRLQREEETDLSKFENLSVLVVDDDEASCESVCTVLNGLAMQSEYVTSGRQAVAKSVQRHEMQDDYYALIIDWKMPDMNGVETAREIRRCVGDDIPIIVISAFDWSDIEQEARAAGVNAFLGKPLFRSKVVNLFSDLLKDKDSSAAEQPATPAPEPETPDFTGKRILVAEDNELNREIAVELFSMMGLEVDTAENGKLCLEKLETSAPGYYDLIFMDVQMPTMNGYEATEAIRACGHPDAKKIPIIAMTANAFSTDVRKAFDTGMNGHIAKPIDMNVVAKTLREFL